MPIKSHLLTRVLRLLPLVASFGLAAYALWQVAVSGIIPTKYVLAGLATLLITGALTAFLWCKWFKTRNRRVVARITAIILMLLVLLVSSAGLYAFNRGLDTLNNLTPDNENSVTIETKQSFNVFISGIDTYGDIATQSRSDVNIVATINPVTHKVLLTTLPRDSYVAIALGGNDGMDKLTHAGNYGPESSTATVARLLDTDIEAYVRINFTSFIESIDTIGGITINNPTEFTIDGQTFPTGQLNLNGQQALLYSRERKSLAGGDVDRGKNQQRVAQGVLDKVTQIRSLSGFEAILNMVGSSVDTNLSQATIRGLINQQINSPAAWTTESYTLTGKGQTGGLPSYAMPSASLYMYVLDLGSIETAKQNINNVLDE